MIKLSIAYVAGLSAIALLAGADLPVEGKPSNFDRDRAAILGMAGDFHVTFRFDETLTLCEESTPSKRHVSRGHETVKVIEDRGEFISMQHLLVVENDDGEQHVVKHWRQDWAYEPARMLVYRGKHAWKNVDVSADERSGAWSQTVYQVDDSPRYAAVAAWHHIGDYSYWEAPETWRPLPRREMKEREDYDVVVGMNRHSLTPEGWAHEQDNYKLALRDGGKQVLARETGLNTYKRVTDYDFGVAGAYWEATAAFWEGVRAKWSAAESSHATIRIEHELDGKKLYDRVMAIAGKFKQGEYESVEAALTAFDEELARYVESK